MFSDKQVRAALVSSCRITLRDWHAVWASRGKRCNLRSQIRSSIQGKHQQAGFLRQGYRTAENTSSSIEICVRFQSAQDLSKKIGFLGLSCIHYSRRGETLLIIPKSACIKMQATLPLSTMLQDFSHQNLRGRNFKNQDLTGANFSHADIRSANFTNAILIGANFTKAKAGMQRRWATVLVIFSLFLSLIAGFFSAFAGILVAFFFIPELIEFTLIPGVMVLIILVVFLFATIRQGLGAGAAAVGVAAAVTGAALVAGEVAGSVAEAMAGAVARKMVVSIILPEWAILVPGAAAVTGAMVVTGAGAGAVGVTVAGAVAGARRVAVIGAVAGAVATMAGGAARGVAGALADRGIPTETIVVIVAVTVTGAVAMGVAVAAWSNSIAGRALAGDEKHAFVRKIALFFAAMGGTNFRNTNLTDANFTQATLKCTKFTGANLTRTRFYEAKELHLARVGKSILDNTAIRTLLVTGNGREKSYLGANLRGANLIGADLSYANLKEADISEATFQGAILEWTKLTLTQAIDTDFTNAHMTGACVEAWNIENSTNLDNVDCRFIYLLEHPREGTDDRERRPSSGEFKPGEFTKLFEEVLNTVDLIFKQGIDWKAFVAAFNKVQVENESTELAIQSIENKGDGVIVLRVRVPPDTNKEKIHSEFTQNYELALKEVEKYKELYEYQRKNYSDMHEIVKLLASQSHQVILNNEVTSTSESNPVQENNQYNLPDATVSGSNIGTNHGTQIGTQHNYATKQNLAEAAEDIKKLLQQLEQTYPTNTPSEKMVVVTEAIKQIEDDQTLKQRVLGALKSGGVEAIKELVDHPLINILLAALEGWQTGE
ncbi:pentapeptide repeat-containing protein [Microcoleus sp. B5-D4]|uniref:pentapeptide repeat-containing protein n=1 Tax=Microcoleus sp. B5-D4 TaxID=2818681 RepID=UPI002FCF8A94